jgi:Raf kinase inhibitor-like YbhB/YbcL family protein
MQLTSTAFSQGQAIPSKFTCEGQDISPEFAWNDAPKSAKSFALVLHDPDAPGPKGFTHWVMFNISPNIAHLAENVPKRPNVAGLGMQGKNDAGKIGYMGPCPPSGKHRYFAHLYALRRELALEPGVTDEELKSAMQGQVIEKAELMGTYQKGAKKAA